MGCTEEQKLEIERILMKDLLLSNNEHTTVLTRGILRTHFASKTSQSRRK